MAASLSSTVFTLVKAGNAEFENEDAAIRDDRNGVYAIADGATEGAYSRSWAIALVEKFREQPLRDADAGALHGWLPSFHTLDTGANEKLRCSNRPWFVERGLERGNYSSLLGVTFDSPRVEGSVLSWKAIAVGDSCLFHFDSDHILRSFPLDITHDFHDSPVLISTLPSTTIPPIEPATTNGVLAAGEYVVLATDALAAWFLEQSNTEWSAVQALLNANNERAFTLMIEQERIAGRLRNDDSTAIIVQVIQDSAF